MEVIGHATWKPAGRFVLFASIVFDLSVLLLIDALFAKKWMYWQPFSPGDTLQFITVFACISAYFALPFLIFKKTVGQWIWGIKWIEHAPHIADLSKSKRQITNIITVGILSLTLIFSWFVRREHPFSSPKGDSLILGAQIPGGEWMVMPYYYAIGSFPKTFGGKPVFIHIPYEKGPPKRFIDKMILRWAYPEILLTVEGPKTPASLPLKTHEFRSCFSKGETGASPFFYKCQSMRNKVLVRHFLEMKKINPSSWDVRWFEAPNTSVPQEEWAQGVLIQARSSEKIIERFILINAEGIQQSLILERPAQSGPGEQARSLVETIIRSTRVFTTLEPGKAWAAKALAGVSLNDLQSLADTLSFARKVSEIHLTLASQLSVKPSDLQAYYHLGGTAFMLAKHTIDLRVQRHQIVSPHMLTLLDEWSAIAKLILESTRLFAKDVSDDSKESQRLESLWLEAQKL